MSTTTIETPIPTADYAKAQDEALAAFEPAYYMLGADAALDEFFEGKSGPLNTRAIRTFRRTGSHLRDAAAELLDLAMGTTDERAFDLAHASARIAATVAMAIEPLQDDGTWPGLEEHTDSVAYAIHGQVTNEYRRILEEE